MTNTDPTNSSETIAEFCAIENISKSVYYDLKKRGIGPDEFRIAGTTIVRITPEAHAAWRERMTELAKEEVAKLEAERRSAQTAEAGRLAAQSPWHVSRRGVRSARHRSTRR